MRTPVVAWFLAAAWASTGCSSPRSTHGPRSATGSEDGDAQPTVIHDFANGLVGVRSAKPELKLRVDRDSAAGGEPLLLIDYPAPSGDPAGRDVYLEAAHRDWTTGSALLFRIKPSHATRLSVSFLDRNHVAYTTWAEIRGGVWQSIRIPFSEIRPNPYFQPPDAKRGASQDVSDVGGIGLAPHDSASGQLAISRIVVVK
jgi:hypothetical protein